ncbi:beta-ketoacyl synthase [Bacillus amyloliquefaciens]|uniref:beta-ketoacyl synthase N-terminal-like domain-containing protein n=1 Tax=Bacillus amyloliquefaciens TaxID=1390 RepID=UPI0010AC035E|nr:beta-ketoacyl synthase N-terminal-like domain-containing protein [Bacillus amyloliquefaciens]TJZ66752.1 beta-ketoacyl synthase [Bacillus amyloliquefaciens]
MNIIGRGKVLSETISVESIRNNVEINGILEPENFDIKQYVKYKGLRSLTKATNLAIASISEAITDAGSRYSEHSPERIGVFVGSTLNPLDAAYHFMTDVYEASPDFVSPVKFSSSVLNNISGWASIVYGITGLNSTVISGNLSGIDALKMAVSYINNNVIDVAIVTAVEGNEAGSIYQQGNLQKKVNAVTGAISFIIEKDENNYPNIENINSFQHTEDNRDKIIMNLEKDLNDGITKNLIYGSNNCNDEIIFNYLKSKKFDDELNILDISRSSGMSNALSGFLKLLVSIDMEGETLVIETNEVGNDSIIKINSKIS